MQDPEDPLGIFLYPKFRTMPQWGRFLLTGKQPIAVSKSKEDFSTNHPYRPYQVSTTLSTEVWFSCFSYKKPAANRLITYCFLSHRGPRRQRKLHGSLVFMLALKKPVFCGRA